MLGPKSLLFDWDADLTRTSLERPLLRFPSWTRTHGATSSIVFVNRPQSAHASETVTADTMRPMSSTQAAQEKAGLLQPRSDP